MSAKTVAQYRKVFIFRAMKRKYNRLTGNIMTGPEVSIQDFEVAMITAIETEYPNTNVRGIPYMYNFYFILDNSLWDHMNYPSTNKIFVI